MNSKTKTMTALAFTALLVSAGGIAFAAPGSIDSSATDTTEITYVSDGEKVTSDFNASASEVYGLPVLNSTTSDLAMNVSHEGRTYYSFSGTWDGYDSGQATTSDDYLHNFTEQDLADVPMAINENVTLNVSYWKEGDAANKTTIQITVQNTDERAVKAVGSSELESSGWAETTTEEHSIARWKADENHVSVDDTVDVNGSNTTVVYSLHGNNATEPFENATSAFSSSGAWTLMESTAKGENTEYVAVFYKSAPSDYNISDAGTYGVYDPDTNMVTFHLSSSNFDGRNQADVDFSTNQYTTFDIYTVYKRFGTDGVQDVLAASV